MDEKTLRKNISVLTVSTVCELTGLTPRKLRYYEKFKLVYPKRSEGNQRLYSLNDIDRLFTIKDYLSSGMTMKEIQRVIFKKNHIIDNSQISDSDARKVLSDDMQRVARFNRNSSNQFFKRG